MKEIHEYEDFLEDLYQAGMSIGGTNNEGVFSLSDYFGENIRWHTEDVRTDPWEWRIRVLHECTDIAYGKYFFKKSGYITKEWYPCFYRVRRGSAELAEEYMDGKITPYARRIYELLYEHKELPLHLIKQYGGFVKEDKSRFDNAITQLQMGFYIQMCGKARKVSKAGGEYGWSSMVFCLSEDFFDDGVMKQAAAMSFEQAYGRIEEQIYRWNPDADSRKVSKFILG